VQNLVLGGLITLVVTTIVQLFVIPRVQRGTRGLERWEGQVIDLRAVLEEEMPRTLNNLRSARYTTSLLASLKDSPNLDQARLAEVTERESTKYTEANEALGELLSRASRLEGRISLVNRTAPFWVQLEVNIAELRIALFKTESWWDGADTRTDDEWKAVWSAVNDAHEVLLNQVKTLAATMDPPPTYPIRRFRALVKKKTKRAIRRGGGPTT
jgi:hypothetical protein